MKKFRQLLPVLLLGASVTATAQENISISRADYSVPAWTQLQRLLTGMQSSQMPYSINMTVNGDPRIRLGFAWFTNESVKSGLLQIVEMADAKAEDFETPAMVVTANSVQTDSLSYSVSKNQLGGVESGQKIVYTSHKALAEGLKPGTEYSFRVGNEGAWSEIGHFRTADDAKEYEFIYITDTQVLDDASFEDSRKTVQAAISTTPNAAFVLCNGDLVESFCQSEWEYEQWFSTLQNVWMNYPLVVSQGNHDAVRSGGPECLPAAVLIPAKIPVETQASRQQTATRKSLRRTTSSTTSTPTPPTTRFPPFRQP